MELLAKDSGPTGIDIAQIEGEPTIEVPLSEYPANADLPWYGYLMPSVIVLCGTLAAWAAKALISSNRDKSERLKVSEKLRNELQSQRERQEFDLSQSMLNGLVEQMGNLTAQLGANQSAYLESTREQQQHSSAIMERLSQGQEAIANALQIQQQKFNEYVDCDRSEGEAREREIKAVTELAIHIKGMVDALQSEFDRGQGLQNEAMERIDRALNDLEELSKFVKRLNQGSVSTPAINFSLFGRKVAGS